MAAAIPPLPSTAQVAALQGVIRWSLQAATRGYVLAKKSQEHGDRMIIWATGLMGAGLFALPTFLTTACGSSEGRLVRVAIPWVLGLLLALGARTASGLRRDREDMFFSDKRAKLEGLLLGFLEASATPMTQNVFVGFRESLLMINGHAEAQMAKRYTNLRRLHLLAEALYYGALFAFGVGIVCTFWAMLQCHPLSLSI